MLFWQLYFITDMPQNGLIRLLFPNIFPGGMPPDPPSKASALAFGPLALNSDQLAPFCQMEGGVGPFFWVPKCIPEAFDECLTNSSHVQE